MKHLLQKKYIKTVAVIVACLLLLGIFLLLGPPKLLEKSESPGFCARCHVMESEYTNFMHSGAHRRLQCVDCHLPHENPASHYTWKSIDGMKDVIHFYSGIVPERIELSDHGKRVVQQNCIRCHSELVSQIDQSRNCWECHRSITHIGTGAAPGM
ncbi:MAG: cytochrome c nitrite reductase small subunit [Desulfuromonadales bacterium]|nr:cytochrome c nitrite reductase small subunit [Desulfuromonadales bacterium]